MLTYSNVEFDFYTRSTIDCFEPKHSYHWSRICATCLNKVKARPFQITKTDGISAPCGVNGCENEVDFYIDFDGTETITKTNHRLELSDGRNH